MLSFRFLIGKMALAIIVNDRFLFYQPVTKRLQYDFGIFASGSQDISMP